MSGKTGDIDSHNRAMSLTMGEIVRELVDILGATTVAAIGGVGETRAVAQWMQERDPQRPHVLRFAHQLAGMISGAASPGVARAWFNGSNPQLGDRTPVWILSNEPLMVSQPALLEAARSFARFRDGAPNEQ